MSEALLRYGIAGTGMMGLEHLRSLAALPGTEVVALADPDTGSLAAAAAEADPGVSTYKTSADLVAAGGIDVLVVAS